MRALLINSRECKLLCVDMNTYDSHSVALERMELDQQYRKEVQAEATINNHLTFVDRMLHKRPQSGKKTNSLTMQRPTCYRVGEKKPTTLPHVNKDLKGRIPAFTHLASPPPCVEKGKQLMYENIG